VASVAMMVAYSPGAVAQTDPEPEPLWYSFPSGGSVDQLVYSQVHDLLFVRNSATQIRIIDLASGTVIDRHPARARFTDLSVSPDGAFVFAADYGGTDIGLGTASAPSYVHRYDIVNAEWTVHQAPDIAYRVEAISGDRVLLLEQDQWVDLTINSYSPTGGVLQLDSFGSLYQGDIEYDANTGLIFHGSDGISPASMSVVRLTGDSLAGVLETDFGAVPDGDGSVVLNSDRSRLFYGANQYEAADITNQIGPEFPQFVLAATNSFAFDAEGGVWFLPSGERLGFLPWASTAMHATPGGVSVFFALDGGEEIRACFEADAELFCVAPSCDGKPITIDMNLDGVNGIGTAGDDVILGTPGDDIIDGLGGNDTICAIGGNDVVTGGDGNDVIFGEDGNDVLRGGPGNDYLAGGSGDDRVLGGIGDDEMFGEDGNDYLGGFGGADLIEGGDGNDRIFGGFGGDTINGGAGSDVINGLIGNDIINGGLGADTVNGDAGRDEVRGGPGADTVNGGNSFDLVFGDGGDDILSGGKADDTLDGGAGFDECAGNKHFSGDTAVNCEREFGIE
jgi:Ca2+-binding RTX toxin-like protein